MKTTSKFIIAAMAAISVFSSCQKELVNESANNTTDGIRVISVQFDNSTKASLNEYTPSFVDGDLIRVSNDTKSEVCTLVVSETTTFTTTLSGELTAIYPAAAAVLTSDAAEAPIAASNSFKVLATQTGKVEDAIIAKATVAEEESIAKFQGVTALFEITPPSTAKKIIVKSLAPVKDGVARTGTAADINTEDTDKTKITVGDGNTNLPTTIYVSLVHGVNLTDLSFDAGETVGMKGIPAKDITAAGKENATAANTKYTIGKSGWHPYVEIGGKKWATENVGATDTNPYGTYFEWGNTTGHALKESPVGKTGEIKNAFVGDYKFSWANCPYQTINTTEDSKTKFTKYLGSNSSSYKDSKATYADASKAVLDLADDAAYANWGGAWRMPTGGVSGEFKALADATSNAWDNTNKGRKFTDKNSAKKYLFFPAAGHGNNTSLWNEGSSGYYWSSSLVTYSPYEAHSLDFTSSEVDPQDINKRSLGRPVRPVAD